MKSRRETRGDARGRFALVVLSCSCALGLSSCGDEVEYYQDGARRAEGRLAFSSERRIPGADERELGTWTWWYPNGERRESGTYTDGKRSGEWTQWYPNGQRRSRGSREFDAVTHSSPREGTWTFWHETGVIIARGPYVKGLREGPWTFWYDNGDVASFGPFVKGRREGHWEFSREDRSLDTERTGEYHLDQRID